MWTDLLDIIPQYPIVFLDTNVLHQLLNTEHDPEVKAKVLEILPKDNTYISTAVQQEVEWQAQNGGKFTLPKSQNTLARLPTTNIQVFDFYAYKHKHKTAYLSFLETIIAYEEMLAANLMASLLSPDQTSFPTQWNKQLLSKKLTHAKANIPYHLNVLLPIYPNLKHDQQAIDRGHQRFNKLHGEWEKMLQRSIEEMVPLYSVAPEHFQSQLELRDPERFARSFERFKILVQHYLADTIELEKLTTLQQQMLNAIHYLYTIISKHDRRMIAEAVYLAFIDTGCPTLMLSNDKDTLAYTQCLTQQLFGNSTIPLKSDASFGIWSGAGTQVWDMN
ncbi:MAG: PIN domain-containing protein [Aureispira sp.]|nr:PIN domain-containing protein [Aureispira sp.]